MSRHHPHDISAILQAAETWQTDCLIGDGAVFGVSDIWTAQNIEALFKAYSPQLDDADDVFLEKLRGQLSGQGQIALLCAEMLWVMYLFPEARHTEPQRKRTIITRVASWSGTKIDPAHPLLDEPLTAGIGSPGSSYDQRRWTELAYFIKVLRDIKSKSSTERRNLLAFPWAFGRYLDDLAGASNPRLTNMLRYLLFPDRYEPIFTRGGKRRIVAAFHQIPAQANKSWTTTQLDRELLKIRKEQVAAHGTTALSFFHEPLLSVRKDLEKAQNQRDLQSSDPDPPDSGTAPASAPRSAVEEATTEDQVELDESAEYNDIIDPDSVLDIGDAGEIVHAEQDEADPERRMQKKPPADAATPQPVRFPLNQIFYGPPGTGKTYLAMQRAVEICDGSVPASRAELMTRYRALEAEQRIRFITLHESYGYQDFVEGIRPNLEELADEDGDRQAAYSCRPGVLKQIADSARGALGKTSNSFTLDRKQTIWKLSLGDGLHENKMFEDAIQGGFIALGYGEDIDFSGCTSRDAIYQRLIKVKPQLANSDYSVSALHYFCSNMQLNDLVVVSDGNVKVRAIGRITGNYQHSNRALSSKYHQLRGVEWLAVFKPSLPLQRISTKQFSQRALYKLDTTILRLNEMEKLARAQQDGSPNRYVLIVDEINRGNVLKIFGELITLLEEDKREGAENGLSIVLPVSNQSFSMPPNLHLVGTMSDSPGKGLDAMDPALRRRFVFYKLQPEAALIAGSDGSGNITDEQGHQINLRRLLEALNQRIQQRHHQEGLIGHSYFMQIKDAAQLRRVIDEQLLPTLQGQFHGDVEEVQQIIDKLLPTSAGGQGGQPQWSQSDPRGDDGAGTSRTQILQ